MTFLNLIRHFPALFTARSTGAIGTLLLLAHLPERGWAPPDSEFKTEHRPDLLNGVIVKEEEAVYGDREV